MKILGEKGLGSLLKNILKIAFVLIIVVMIIIPIICIITKTGIHPGVYILYPAVGFFLIIVKQFIGLFYSLETNTPFSENTVIRLKKAKTGAIGISAYTFLVTVFAIFIKDFFAVFIYGVACILFFGVSIALYILAELFRQANDFKEENDLTI